MIGIATLSRKRKLNSSKGKTRRFTPKSLKATQAKDTNLSKTILKEGDPRKLE